MHIPIDAIETVLAHAGITTDYYGDDDRTVFTMENGAQVIVLVDAVSGDFFRPEDLTEAVLDSPFDVTNITPSFESVETLEEFITAVNDTFGTVK